PGTTFETTDTTPSAPPSMAAAALASSPQSTAKPSLRSASHSCSLRGSDTASFTPAMRGWPARPATVDGCRSQPVRGGTLYITTGSPPSSATARKCASSPDWVGRAYGEIG